MSYHWTILNGTLRLAYLLMLLAWPSETLTAQDNPFLPSGHPSFDWSFIRGPGFDGHSPEIHLADEWPSEGPPVLWTRELGQGYSAFVAEGGRVYTQGQTLAGQYLYCLDADSGKSIWSYRYDWPYEGMGVYPGPRATPTVRDGRVFFASPSGLIGCVNAETGKLIWSRNVLEDYDGEGGDEFGYSCTPVVIDGMVILPVGGKSASLVALDVADGKEIWSEGDDPGSYAPVYPITRNGRKLVIGYLQNSLVIHDRRTGEVLIRLDLSQGYDEHSCWPIYREPYLWISGPFRSGSRLYEIPEDLTGTPKLKQIWTSRDMSNDVDSSVLVGEELYGFDLFDVQSKTQRPSRGKFCCMNFLTGEEYWTQGTGRARRGGDQDDPEEIGQSELIVADGKLIVFNERGELLLLKPNSKQLEILARASVLGGELSWTPPALHRGRIYVRNHSRAVCVYVGDPDLLDVGQQTLTLADVPQTSYRNLAAVVLPVEPEYMFDLPAPRWLWNWYFAGISILALSGLLSWGISLPFSAHHRPLIQTWGYRTIAFVAGALGTTVISSVAQEFYFTWTVCAFIAFEPVIEILRSRRTEVVRASSRWSERFTILFFVAVCVLYYWLCRRLSLVFEWSFLMGFAGAIPFLMVRKRLSDHRTMRYLIKPALTLIAFSGFYACGVLLLLWRY